MAGTESLVDYRVLSESLKMCKTNAVSCLINKVVGKSVEELVGLHFFRCNPINIEVHGIVQLNSKNVHFLVFNSAFQDLVHQLRCFSVGAFRENLEIVLECKVSNEVHGLDGFQSLSEGFLDWLPKCNRF